MKTQLNAFNAKRKIKTLVTDKTGKTSEMFNSQIFIIKYNRAFPYNHKMLH